MEGTYAGALVGLISAAVLALLGIFGRRFEGRETRAVSTQAAVIDDLESSNTRLRMERDEARALLAEEASDHRQTARVLWEIEEQHGLPHRRLTDQAPLPRPLPDRRVLDGPLPGRRRDDGA